MRYRNIVWTALVLLVFATTAHAQTLRVEWTQEHPTNPQGLTYRIYYGIGASLVLSVTCVPAALGSYTCNGVAVEPPGWITAYMTVAETWLGESAPSDPVQNPSLPFLRFR